MQKQQKEIADAFYSIENEDDFINGLEAIFPEGIERKYLMKFLSDHYKKIKFKTIKEDSTETTKTILSLSRTKSGYNLSNLKRKKEISDKIKYLTLDAGDENAEKKKLYNFIEQLYLKKGYVNIDYIVKKHSR